MSTNHSRHAVLFRLLLLLLFPTVNNTQIATVWTYHHWGHRCHTGKICNGHVATSYPWTALQKYVKVCQGLMKTCFLVLVYCCSTPPQYWNLLQKNSWYLVATVAAVVVGFGGGVYYLDTVNSKNCRCSQNRGAGVSVTWSLDFFLLGLWTESNIALLSSCLHICPTLTHHMAVSHSQCHKFYKRKFDSYTSGTLHRKILRNLEESGLKQLATLILTHISLSLGKSIPALKYIRWSTIAFCFGSCGYKESSDA